MHVKVPKPTLTLALSRSLQLQEHPIKKTIKRKRQNVGKATINHPIIWMVYDIYDIVLPTLNQLGQNTGSRLTALLSRLDAASEVDRLCDTEVQNVSEKIERTKMNQANIEIVT